MLKSSDAELQAVGTVGRYAPFVAPACASGAGSSWVPFNAPKTSTISNWMAQDLEVTLHLRIVGASSFAHACLIRGRTRIRRM